MGKKDSIPNLTNDQLLDLIGEKPRGQRKASDQDALLELSRREPKVFRAMLEIDGSGSERVRYANVIAPFQEKDFAALDPIFMWTAGSPGAQDPERKKAWIQRARGHSKTTDNCV